MLGETPSRLRAGDIFLVPRGDAYVMTSSEEACRRAETDEAAALGFFRRMAAGELPFVVREGGGGAPAAKVVCGFLGLDIQPFNPVVSALPAALCLRVAAGPGADRLRRLVEYAVTEARRPRPGSHCTLIRLGELLFVEVIRRCVGQLDDAPRGWLTGLEDPVVGRCLALMHRRPADPWTLASLAKELACSRSSLAERFAARIGDPPMRYLARWRMQLASQLLEQGDTTVEAVAHRVGYSAGAAFSRAFKRLAGVSPSEWRRATRPERFRAR